MAAEAGRRAETFFLSQQVNQWARKDERTVLSFIG